MTTHAQEERVGDGDGSFLLSKGFGRNPRIAEVALARTDQEERTIKVDVSSDETLYAGRYVEVKVMGGGEWRRGHLIQMVAEEDSWEVELDDGDVEVNPASLNDHHSPP